MLFERERRPLFDVLLVKVLFTFSHVLVELVSALRFELASGTTVVAGAERGSSQSPNGDRSHWMRDATESRAGYICGEGKASLTRMRDGVWDRAATEEGEGGT